jgi:MYXO-CTERM domain-containing protein
VGGTVTSGSSGNAGDDLNQNKSGCSCRVSTTTSPGAWLFSLALGVGLVARRRRKGLPV